MNDLPADNKDVFSAWLRERAESAGYRFDGARSGGLTRLAEDSGVTISVISRALAGERMPDVQTLRALARPLRTNLREMLIRSGQADESDLPSSTTVGTMAGLTADDILAVERQLAALQVRRDRAQEDLARARQDREAALHHLRVAEATAAQATYRVEMFTSELMELHMRLKALDGRSVHQD